MVTPRTARRTLGGMAERRNQVSVGRRWLRGAVLAVGGVACYAVVSVSFLGLVWPYPLMLPGSFTWRGTRYERALGCWPSAGAAEQVLGQLPVPVGTLGSALWFGEQPIYSYEPSPGWPAQRTWLLVRDGPCLRIYPRYVND